MMSRACTYCYIFVILRNDIKLNVVQVDFGGEGRLTIKMKPLKNPMYLYLILKSSKYHAYVTNKVSLSAYMTYNRILNYNILVTRRKDLSCNSDYNIIRLYCTHITNTFWKGLHLSLYNHYYMLYFCM